MSVLYTPTGFCDLREGRSAEDVALMSTPYDYRTVMLDYDNLPDLNIDDWLFIEDQANQGSCQGNSLTSNGEYIALVTYGVQMQFSRQGAYIQSQKKSGISGDRGSTIDGGIAYAMEEGFGLESVWPYPNRYDPRVPSGWATADKWKLRQSHPIRSYTDMVSHFAQLLGLCHSGFMWHDILDRQAANGGVITQFRGGGSGGHSVMWGPYDKTMRDEQNRPYIWLTNSWSRRWGLNGRVRVKPSVVDDIIQSKWAVFAGPHGMVGPQPKLAA